jgi:uroporphyrin-III C-methyltransferase
VTVGHYPVFLYLRERSCLVVGSGPLAEEKVRGLLEAGARVTQHERDFLPEDLDGMTLAIVCGQPPEVVEEVWVEARRRGVLVNTVDDVPHCDFIAPSILRRGDLAIAISTGGKAPALAVRLRQRLEREIGDEHARFLEMAGSVRVALAAKRPDFSERRESWYRLVDSDVLERLRVGDEAGAVARFGEILGVEPLDPHPPNPPLPPPSHPPGEGGTVSRSPLQETGGGAPLPVDGRGVGEGSGVRAHGGDAPRRSGRVVLVGAGPGDPDLMTVRGLRCLRQADAVLYDRLVSREILAEASPTAELISVGKEAGKETGHSQWGQEDINALLISLAREGRTVVRLKGGDPFVFGRGAEEALACRAAGVPCEVVPGVSSAVSVPALADIPVTHRGVAGSFAVVTGHCMGGDRLDWSALARIDTLVVLMGLARLPEVAALLQSHGRAADTPAAVIANGSRPDERVVVGTLADIAVRAAEAGLRAPATIVIGEVVRLRERLVGVLDLDRHDPATISACLS